ncbi:hypothetical protein V6N11_037979 [Hibiscus sabdariffa]|uniref:Uncharacterized protein n=1 Tax=Hibiscus sabdariffa TaxID=183260 RepID=A0ABR2ADF1_9ROSI
MVFGGFLTLNLAATVAIGAFRSVAERKRKKFALLCGICKGKGFYLCKLCNGNATIKWSPLYDPIHINPCVCPTCDGNSHFVCFSVDASKLKLKLKLLVGQGEEYIKSIARLSLCLLHAGCKKDGPEFYQMSEQNFKVSGKLISGSTPFRFAAI